MQTNSEPRNLLDVVLTTLHLRSVQEALNKEQLPVVIEGTARNFKEEAKNLKFLHIRSQTDANHAVTIAYLYDRKLKVVYYEVARCSHGDKFCKRIGRDIAKGRYAKYGPDYALNHVVSDADMYERLEILWHPDMQTSFVLDGERYE